MKKYTRLYHLQPAIIVNLLRVYADKFVGISQIATVATDNKPSLHITTAVIEAITTAIIVAIIEAITAAM